MKILNLFITFVYNLSIYPLNEKYYLQIRLKTN